MNKINGDEIIRRAMIRIWYLTMGQRGIVTRSNNADKPARMERRKQIVLSHDGGQKSRLIQTNIYKALNFCNSFFDPYIDVKTYFRIKENTHIKCIIKRYSS